MSVVAPPVRSFFNLSWLAVVNSRMAMRACTAVALGALLFLSHVLVLHSFIIDGVPELGSRIQQYAYIYISCMISQNVCVYKW